MSKVANFATKNASTRASRFELRKQTQHFVFFTLSIGSTSVPLCLHPSPYNRKYKPYSVLCLVLPQIGVLPPNIAQGKHRFFSHFTTNSPTFRSCRKREFRPTAVSSPISQAIPRNVSINSDPGTMMPVLPISDPQHIRSSRHSKRGTTHTHRPTNVRSLFCGHFMLLTSFF